MFDMADGKSLGFALEKEISQIFLELAIMCKAVICCAFFFCADGISLLNL